MKDVHYFNVLWHKIEAEEKKRESLLKKHKKYFFALTTFTSIFILMCFIIEGFFQSILYPLCLAIMANAVYLERVIFKTREDLWD